MRLKSLSAILVPLAFAACLNGTETITYPNVPIESTTFATSLNVNLAASTKTATGIYFRDVTVGTGKTAAAGDSVSVYYSGALANGQLFDQLVAPAAPYGVRLGANRVIPGFEQGLVGMKVGGVRQLIIPPALAYGSAGNSGIPPYSVLVFQVNMVTAQ
ncbi:MAG: FKBP-type peptidyl-prolyl cis-trans isomerase [Gemmatimonadetes bacterium]|nr:FKBP-type peptidyl-prolyl cis-trans isomerase [Gemmatimonadota bacterium]